MAIQLNFTIKEMTDALERIGYTVKLERVEPDWYDTRADEDIPSGRQTYMVYYGNQCVTNGAKFARLYGVDRLEEIFTIELKKRLVGW